MYDTSGKNETQRTAHWEQNEKGWANVKKYNLMASEVTQNRAIKMFLTYNFT